jgi:hypothetical protein
MWIVRRLLRLSIFVMIAFAVAFGLLAVFDAQARLNQQAELYMKVRSAQQPTVGVTRAAASTPAWSMAVSADQSGNMPVPGAGERSEVTAGVQPDIPDALAVDRASQQAREVSVSEVAANTENARARVAPTQDKAGYTSVRVSRFGGEASVYRVPTER